jgi:hypothetical protein
MMPQTALASPPNLPQHLGLRWSLPGLALSLLVDLECALLDQAWLGGVPGLSREAQVSSLQGTLRLGGLWGQPWGMQGGPLVSLLGRR